MSFLRKDLKNKKESNNKDDDTNTESMNAGKTKYVILFIFYKNKESWQSLQR